MARKLNELKFMEETGRHAEGANHRQTSQFVPCFVPIQPQPRIYPPKRRLEIAIEVKPSTEIPNPVKITYSV
jgi:hypothetical protein